MTDVAEPLQTPEAWEPEDTFGARLALIRQHFHWNVTEAAKATGIAPATWTKWEEGSKPRDYMAVCTHIAEAVGCSTKWLVAGSQNWKSLTAPDLRLVEGLPKSVIGTRGVQLEVPFPTEHTLHLVPDLE